MRAKIALTCLVGSAVLCACSANQPWSQTGSGNQNGSGANSSGKPAGGGFSIDAGPAVQGSGKIVTDKRTLSTTFTRLKLAIPADVDVHFADGDSAASITFDENLIPLIKTEVQGETLRIGEQKTYSSAATPKISITTAHLQAVDISGVGTVTVPNTKEDAFNVSVSGKGNVLGNGTCSDLTVRLSGTGNIDLANLQSQAVSIHISGKGNVDVGPSDSMEVFISGVGNVRYKGDAKIEEHITGVGTVTKI